MDFPGGLVVKNPPANAGAQVQSLVQEVSTCHGATKPVHNYWACALGPLLFRNEKPVHCNQKEPVHSNEDPVQPKLIKYYIKNKYFLITKK